jgi:hypothetical protein
MHFAGVNVQRAMLVALVLEGLRGLVLEFELRLQIGRRSHFCRRRALTFEPLPNRTICELRFVANNGLIHIAGIHATILAGHKLDHDT